MTVHLPEGLPAAGRLQGEGIPVAVGGCTTGGSLRLGFLNLMPDKIAAETQFARLFGLSGIDVEMSLLRVAGHRCRHTPGNHLQTYYRSWDEMRPERLDALIVTGAPVETLEFREVDYWPELAAILDRVAADGVPAMYVCWAGQAALHHYYGVNKRMLPRKRFGVFQQSALLSRHYLFAGMAPRFPVPVSRHTEICAADLDRIRGLRVLAGSPETGPCIVEDHEHRALYVFDHFEYDAGTLLGEYERDLAAGKRIDPPLNCTPGATAATPPWRPVARRLFTNWLSSLTEADRHAKVA